MEFSKQNMKKIAFLITFTILLFLGVQNITSVLRFVGKVVGLLSPFIIGACIAFILNVPMRFLERIFFHERQGKIKNWKRPVCLTLTIFLVISIILIVMFQIIPELAQTIRTLVERIPQSAARAQQWSEEAFSQWPWMRNRIADIKIDWMEIGNRIIKFIQNGAGSFLNSTFGVVSSIVSGVANFFIGFVFAVYILFQKEKLARQIKKLLYSFFTEEKTERFLDICRLTDRTFSNFLSGQCMEAVILGMLFFLTMTIFKLPYALLIGILIAFTALIPIFGAFVGCAVGAFLILMVNPVQAVWFIVLFIILQQIEGNLIYPHVVGNSVGLPSIWVLFAVTIGGSTMGIAGMLINIPLCSVLYALLRGFVNQKLALKKINPEKWNG